MRKTLNHFLKSFLILLMVTLGCGVMSGTTYTFFDSSVELPGSWSSSGGTKTISGIVWTYSGASYLALDNTHTKIQVGSAKKPQTSNWTIETPISSFGIGIVVTGVSITAYTTAATATYDISVSGSTVKSGNLTTSSSTYSNTSTLSATSGSIVVTLNGSSSSKAMYLSNISVTYTTGVTSYTITYMNNNGDDPLPTEHNSGSIVTSFPPATPSDECVNNGWVFSGWSNSDNNTAIISSLTISKDTTLYAVYGISNYITTFITDTLTSNDFTATSGAYKNFSNVEKASGALYSGNSATSYGAIRLHTKNSNSGIISTVSGGLLDNIRVVWNSGTAADRWIKVYASDTAFHSTNDLYQGIRTDSIQKGVSEMKLPSKPHIGIRSKENALYLDSILITWKNIIEASTYSTNPKCYDAEVSIAYWSKDSINFNIGEIGTTTNVILLSSGDTVKSYAHSSDNSYRFDRARLDTIPCTDMKFITAKADGTECIRRYQVPIMVYGTGKTVDDVLTMDGCDNCDLVILPNSKLTINKDTASRNVTIYETAVLSIPSGKTYTVNSLTLRRDNDSVPHLSYKGTLDIKNGMFFELRTDADDWRWITLPDTFSASDIRIEPEILLGYYDGEYRAQHGRGAWKNPDDNKEFMPGEGFIYGINIDGTEKRIYKYEIDTAVLKTEKGNKIVPVSDYGYDMHPLPPANDLGWNIVANPYMDIYESDIASNIKIGSLVREPGEPWNGRWIVDPESETKNLRYIVVRSYANDPDIIAAGHYKSILLSDGYRLEPFSSFFIQAAEGVSALIFDKDNTISRAPARRSNVDDRETFLRINVGNRQTGCFISNKFTDEYEVGDDLESMYPIYQLIGGYKLLYSAINDSIINSGVKIYTPSGNLHLDSKTNLNEFDEIYALYNDTWYDLLHGETVDVSGEFILQAKRKAHNDTPTDIEEADTENTFNKILYNGNVYILKNNCIFNVLGERIK